MDLRKKMHLVCMLATAGAVLSGVSAHGQGESATPVPTAGHTSSTFLDVNSEAPTVIADLKPTTPRTATEETGTPITVLNFSFESPDLVNETHGTPNPDSWTAYESNGGDTIIHEARTAIAGATDGDQIAYFDDRTPWGGIGRGILWQNIGVGSDFDGYETLVLTFDARKGGVNGNEAGDGDDPENTFHAYFVLNPTLAPGTLSRNDLNTQVGTAFSTTMGVGGVMRNISAIQGENPAATMDTFTASFDLAGAGPGDTVAIAFEYEFDEAGTPGSHPRVAVDNVRVDALAAVPVTGALIIVR